MYSTVHRYGTCKYNQSNGIEVVVWFSSGLIPAQRVINTVKMFDSDKILNPIFGTRFVTLYFITLQPRYAHYEEMNVGFGGFSLPII
jgi:hypothetical protein